MDWEVIYCVGKVPCPAGKFFQNCGSWKDSVPNDGTEADTRSFAVCLAYCNVEAPDFCSWRTNFQCQYNQPIMCKESKRQTIGVDDVLKGSRYLMRWSLQSL